MKPRILFLIALLCAAIASLQGVHAATITVINTNDSGPGSLRGALASAVDGDTIDFSITTPATITLTSGQLLVNKSVTITGPGADQLSLNGNHVSRVFQIVFQLGSSKTVTISGLTITNGNVSGAFPDNSGAGIYNDRSTLTVNNCTLSGNSASNKGGGIYNNGGQLSSATLTINNSTISGNSAGLGGGGGIFNDGTDVGSGTVTINNSTVSGNSTLASGGGIYNDSNRSGHVTVTINNSTLSGNLATVNGGGIYNDAFAPGSQTLTISNSTLSENSAPFGGGIANRFSGPLTIGDTILKTGASGANIENLSGTVISLGYNLSSDAAGGDGSTVPGGLLNATGDIRNTDPMLGPLQDNGGPTFTHELLTGSPAIDMGHPSFTPPPDYDQRGPGFPRVMNSRIDICFLVVQAPPRPTPTPTPSSSPTPTPTPTPTATPNDFSISVTPPAQTVVQGASTSYTVSTAVISGNPEQISLSLSGLPTGASGSFTSNNIITGGSSTLNINAGTAAPGTYTITVTGTGAANAHSTTATLIITPTPTPNDFSISVTPPAQTVVQGASTSYTVSTAVISGNPETISLSLSGLPTGASGSFTSNNVITGGSSTLNINAGTAAPGTYMITVTRTRAANAPSTTATLIITPTPTPNDFSISVTPPAQTVVQGASTSYTVSTAVISGNPETISLSLSGLPTGASGSFTSNNVITGGSSTLNINAGTAAPGTYMITVTRTRAANAPSTTATLIITPTPTPNDFSISVTPPAQTVVQGASTSYTVSTAVISGNPETISLSLSGLPTGASGSFTSNNVITGGSSTLNINAGTAAPGTYTITVTGTGAANAHSTTATLIITPTPTPND